MCREEDNFYTIYALEKAYETLKIASRQLTEDHRMVLMGRAWGWRTLAILESAIKKASKGE